MKQSLVTIANLTKEKIEYLVEMASEFEKYPNRKTLEGRVVATLFFEPSASLLKLPPTASALASSGLPTPR